MSPDQLLSFGSYRVDPVRGQLWQGTQAVRLTPKTMAVLCVFLTRPGQVVTKEDFFQTVWPQTVVSDATLTVCIQELRRVLRDETKKPRYIETVHRRGYRFIASLTTAPPVQGSKVKGQGPTQPLTPNAQSPTSNPQPPLSTQHSELRQR